jgi:hypothetical protein
MNSGVSENLKQRCQKDLRVGLQNPELWFWKHQTLSIFAIFHASLVLTARL